jgi:hypothetical protein
VDVQNLCFVKHPSLRIGVTISAVWTCRNHVSRHDPASARYGSRRPVRARPRAEALTRSPDIAPVPKECTRDIGFADSK